MIGIVILTYNTWEQTLKCIQSILRQNIKMPYILYVVDNASPIKMPESVRVMAEQKHIVCLSAEKNKGYAAGNNLGIKKALEAGCDAVLIVNNDVTFKGAAVDTLYLYLQNHPNVGIVGPKIRRPDGEMQETNLGCKMTLQGKYLYILRKTPFRRFSQDFVKRFRIKENQLTSAKKVFGVSGCCFMMSSQIIAKIGLLDEHTFLYEEENILGCKMEDAGYEIYLLPETEVIHSGGLTTKDCKAFSFACMVESEIYYCRNYLRKSRIIIFPLYCIRIGEYLKRCVFNSEYRKYFGCFLKKTLGKMNENVLV